MPDITIGVNRDMRGGLNSDDDIQNLAGGNYPDCVNVERNNDSTGGADTPSFGNTKVYEIPAIQKQFQKVRVFDNFIDFANQPYNFIRMSIYNGNGTLYRNSYISGSLYNITTLSGVRAAVQSVLGTGVWNSLGGQVFQIVTLPNGIQAFDVQFNFGYDDYTFELVPGSVDVSSSVPDWYNTFSVVVDNKANSIGTPIDTAYVEYDPIKIRIIQEAYSDSAAGKLHLIGSKEINSKLFMCWTTKTENKSKLNVKITGIYKNTFSAQGGFSVWVNTETPHGLSSYETIILANLSGIASVFNGKWVVVVMSDTAFYLLNSIVPQTAQIPNIPTNYGGEIYINVDGVGVFVVQSYDVQNNEYEYIIPLKSKQLNWVTKNQIDLDVEFFNNVYSLYYNDFLNRPRVTYFNEPVGTDSAIEAINPDAQYDYAILSDQVLLQQNNSSSINITILDQIQGGGSLYSGSYRYGVVLVTESETETEISELSGLIRVYPPAYQEGAMIYGDYGNPTNNAPTNKINRIRVDGIPPGVFKYIDLICVIIDGSNATTLTSTQTLFISRTLLGPDEVSVNLEHNGNEPDIREFTLAKLNPVKETILKAYNNVIGENRLLISNFITTQSVDISSWVDTFKYSIKKQAVYGDWLRENHFGFSRPSQNYGGVDAPVGYQLYEWYRFYVVAEYKEGGFTDAVFCFDVRFVTQDDYNSDDDFKFLTTNGYDRRDFNGDELTTYYLTADADRGRDKIQWGIQIKNIDWEFSFDGVKAKDLFKKLSVYRAERVTEVLASGYLNMAVKYKFGSSAIPNDKTPIDFPCSIKYSSTITTGIDPGATSNVVPRQNVFYSYQDSINLSLRNFASFYSPDYLYNPSFYSFVLGDQIKVFGFCIPAYDESFYSGGSDYTEYCYLRVFKNDPNSSLSLSKSVNIEESYYTPTNTNKYFLDGFLYIKEGEYPILTGTTSVRMFNVVPDTTDYNDFTFTSVLYGRETQCIVMKFDSELNPQRSPSDGAIDFGMYLGVHFRKRDNKYGTRTSNVDILSTDYKILNGESSKVVFGGDVYTQGSFIKKQYFDDSPNPETINGGSASMLMNTQNRINTQLRTLNPNFPNRIYPQQILDWTVWAVKTLNEQEYYASNSGYLEVKDQQLVPSFDRDLITRTTFPTRIIYSELKPNNSVKDFYRLFPPGQFRDNPNNFGAIIHMDIKQGELFTLQELCYTREFLNSTGQLSTIDSGQVIIGDASVLSRPGVRLTSLGSKHKWSYARGLTDSGTDVRCWVNSDFFVVLRAGRDGTVNLTERSFMDTYLRDHMRFVRDKFTPADGQGIHAVWDDVGKNFVITVRGWKDVIKWELGFLGNTIGGGGYRIGQVVQEGEQWGVPVLYKALRFVPAIESTRPGTAGAEGVWERIPFDDIDYYSVFTLCFNEARNRFTHFQTFFPKIYATHFDRYFSPKPHTDESNKFYLMRQGEPLVFYDEEHEGYTEYVINQEPAMLKKFVSIAYNALLKPLRAEFKTQFVSEEGIEERVTTLDRSEFKIRENIVYSTIKNTLDENGQNNQRTAPMKGLWLRIKTFFKARENQKINDIFVPIRMGQRNVKNP